MGRVDDDADIPPLQLTRHLNAGARLQVNIQNRDVGSMGRKPLYSASTTKWASRCVSVILQIIGQVQANSGVALDD
jgi:hypothetical protein